MKTTTYLLLSFLLLTINALAQKPTNYAFQVVPLGIRGGIDESNLSAYLLAPANTTDYICLDAGTINTGIQKAIEKKVFKTTTETVLKKYIKGYFISHAHLDHVSGLIINSPADSTKTIYATKSCMEMMENHYFNGQTWANFGDEGNGFLIKKYHFQTIIQQEETTITNTSMTVKAFPLSHVNPFESTAFLIKNKDDYALYLGDTGADVIEKSNNLETLWTTIAPLIKKNQLKGIFIELSFPNEQPDKLLYGHLTPKLLMKELQNLYALTGTTLQNVQIIITHMKPPTYNYSLIKKQLATDNNLKLNFIFPTQGKKIKL